MRWNGRFVRLLRRWRKYGNAFPQPVLPNTANVYKTKTSAPDRQNEEVTIGNVYFKKSVTFVNDIKMQIIPIKLKLLTHEVRYMTIMLAAIGDHLWKRPTPQIVVCFFCTIFKSRKSSIATHCTMCLACLLE